MRSSDFRVSFVRCDADESRLAALMEEQGLEDPRLRLLMRGYYAACRDHPPTICTIIAEDTKGPALVLPMTLQDRQLSYFSMPASPVYALRLDQSERTNALTAACRLAVEECAASGNGLTLSASPTRMKGKELADWEVQLLKAGGRQIEQYRAHVDLSGGEAGLRSQMRNSYRSLVNWGRREMRLEFVEKSSTDASAFESFRQFHLKVAGRETRPYASWLIMHDLVKRGSAILCLGYLENELVAATYFFYSGRLALYGTGVYDRNRFDKPISHWPVVATMQRLREYGVTRCDLGEVFPNPESSEKEQSIAFFKKGFTDTIIDETYWQVDPAKNKE